MKTFTLAAEDALAEVVPGRGALCTRLRFGDEDVLYLDESTLLDPSKNVRGGIPVLFPIAGKPEADSLLKQHGFARTLPWEPDASGPARLRCTLSREADDAYPFAFDAELLFQLEPRTLRLSFSLHSRAPAAMPFQLGFHPYFAVRDKALARASTDATRAFDNVAGAERPYAPPRLDTGETDLHLLDHRLGGTSFLRDDGALQLEWSPEFTRLVLWTLPDKPFVCVEPWTARSLALAPGATTRLAFSISRASP